MSKITLVLLPVLLVGSSLGANASVCDDDPARQQLDFLLGSWTVSDASGRAPDSNTIVEKDLDGCLVQERVEASDESGVGWHRFDPTTGSWRMSWVDSVGRAVEGRGTWNGDRLEVEGEMRAAQGGALAVRATITPKTADRIEQTWESSPDGGTTWQPFWNGTWTRRGTGAPRVTQRTTPAESAPSEPGTAPAPSDRPTRAERAASPAVSARSLEPEPEPDVVAEPGTVRVLSAKANDRGPEKIRMSSPMQLQLDVGPVEKLPKGYGWVSTDTASYTADGTVLERVRLERIERRGTVQLELELAFTDNSFTASIGVLAELLDADGNVVDTVEDARFPIGKNLPEQVQNGEITKEFTYSLERERFEQPTAWPLRQPPRF